jgi:predicted DCC family thiol-disulfide oxidoreductase YuxK
MADKAILLVYDKECPVCNAYCQAVRIDERAGALKIVNAREVSGVMDEITALELDIDQGMVLKKDGRIHYGSDAIHELALIGRRSGIFNRINAWAFHTRTWSGALYPVLRSLRNLLLKLLGKTRINNLGRPGNVRF